MINSVLRLFPDAVRGHIDGTRRTSEPYIVAPIVDIEGDRAILDLDHARKQPDWTYDDEFSGKSPADRIDERAHYHGE